MIKGHQVLLDFLGIPSHSLRDELIRVESGTRKSIHFVADRQQTTLGRFGSKVALLREKGA